MKRILGTITAITLLLILMTGCSEQDGGKDVSNGKYMVDTEHLQIEYTGRADKTTEGFLEAQDVFMTVENKYDEDIIVMAMNLYIDGVEFDAHKIDYYERIPAGETKETAMQVLKRYDKYEFNDEMKFDLIVFLASNTDEIENAFGVTLFIDKEIAQ